MKLQIRFKEPGFADCDIQIRAKGCLAAMFRWADEANPLPGWSSIAIVPIDPAGNGSYRFRGRRAIPAEATHIYAKSISQDLTAAEEVFTEIPLPYRGTPKATELLASFSVMSDLHLSGKLGRISRALRMASARTILIPGDLTNDGFTEQFEAFKQCIDANVSGKLVLSVTGNHDQLLRPDPEAWGYTCFQRFLFDRAAEMGYRVETDASGAYSVQLGEIDVIGLQCVSFCRKFVFPEGAQLKWLEKHLDEHFCTGWHMIMCHAPLLAHNPHRNTGGAYLSRDEHLQKIVDRHGHIMFLSGHTHFSPNMEQGCVEYDAGRRILYINAGSVTPTELSGEALMPAEWKDGVLMELRICAGEIEIKTKSIHTGICYPRGYYRFKEPLNKSTHTS